MQVFLVLSKENCCRDKRARQFTKRCSKYKKNASSHVPNFNNEHVFFSSILLNLQIFVLEHRMQNEKFQTSTPSVG